VLANTPLGLLGFGIACMVLHLTAEPLGVVAGLSLALATSIGWNLAVIGGTCVVESGLAIVS
jgi:succinate-acetate transporter protein